MKRLAVDLRRYIVDGDEEDVCDVSHCAAPPFTTRQHVAVDEDVGRPDVLVNSQKAQILQETHILHRSGVVCSKYDVVDDVWHLETLSITHAITLSTPENQLLFAEY